MVVQKSAAYRRLVSQMPANLVLFDGMCPYCEHNIHWVLSKNLSWEKETDANKIIHVMPNNIPDAKYVLSHFPHSLYRVQETVNELKPEDTIILLEKRPSRKFAWASMQRAHDMWTRKAQQTGLKRELVDQSSSVLEDVEYEVHLYSKSEAVFRIGMKLDDFTWRWACTLAYYCIPRWFANERYDLTALTRYDRWGRHTKMPKFSEEIRFRTWKLPKK